MKRLISMLLLSVCSAALTHAAEAPSTLMKMAPAVMSSLPVMAR